MNDYGKNPVLGAVLPTTSAAGIFFADAHPVVLVGFFALALIGLVNLVGYVSRYFINNSK